jgi:hypothetical protein
VASDVADEMSSAWLVEEIPDGDYLFLRVHKSHTDADGEPFPHAFRNQPKGSSGMSTDWSKYTTPADTQGRGKQARKEYAIVKFTAGHARAIPGQRVVHEPSVHNRAHSEVFGDKTTEVRERFMQIYQIEIPLGVA